MPDYQQGTAINITDTFTVAGVATNPTNVVYKIMAPSGTVTQYTFPGAPEIANPQVGSFVLSLGAVSEVGYYSYDVNATGAVTASRQGSFTVLGDPTTPDPDVTWAVPGPCQSWASSTDVWNCCGQPLDADNCPVDMTPYALEASQVLFELSGRLFVGACSKTVRPCSSKVTCGVQVLSRGHVIGWTDFGWDGVSCGCTPLDRVLLSGYPVREITEVKIDGDVVDPNTYRLDGWRYLVRTNGLFWPSCQAMDLWDTEDGTFSVTYRYGQDPPLVGSHAAAQLGCEIYKACAGSDCALPTGTTRVVRQGVVIERLAFSAWGLQNGIWRTGLNLVDAFLNGVNRSHLIRRPTVWSPARNMQYARREGI